MRVLRTREPALEAARFIADAIRDGATRLALSGGRTPWEMCEQLASMDLPWEDVHIWQVDERDAPEGHADRNLTHLRETLMVPANFHPMPVADARGHLVYARELPAAFDLVHLGMGEDGHTASLLPGDKALNAKTAVAWSAVYQGRRRMTLTLAGLARAQEVLWLVAGAAKAEMLERLLAGDVGIPAGRIQAARSTVITDIGAP
jgi:6-phosphogluconolactonase